MPGRAVFVTTLALMFVATTGSAQPASARECEMLTGLSIDHGTVKSAEAVDADRFSAPASLRRPRSTGPDTDPSRTPVPVCRVTATLTPTSDSRITVEVWLPRSGWNGKFLAMGNRGWAGEIDYRALAWAAKAGYASASTDTGHEGSGAAFALGHSERLADFGHRAVHLMTVTAKAVVAAFYGRGPSHAYWFGCSTAGKQGLTEAQRYPADYDGIIAAAPAVEMLRVYASQIWVAQAMHASEASFIPHAKRQAIHAAVLRACDGVDGVKDQILGNPRACTFDPASMTCARGDGPACLTPAQVAAVRKIYAGPTNPRTDARIFPGLERGSELGWTVLAGDGPPPAARDAYRFVVFKNPAWDWKTLNFDTDIAKADAVDGGTVNADLRAFFARGGKLLMYHGWSDPQVAPGSSIDYYRAVLAASGGHKTVDQSMRLFMVPGMMHCSGGRGPTNVHSLGILERWVEKNIAPDSMVAIGSHGIDGIWTALLCPHPQVARYSGIANTDSASSFSCVVP